MRTLCKKRRSNPISYLEGSKAITNLDSQRASSSSKIPKHFREWYSKAKDGLLEDEANLWTTQKSVQIVRDFMAGRFSKREDLAIEKLIYEVRQMGNIS